MLDNIGIDQPEWLEVTSLLDATTNSLSGFDSSIVCPVQSMDVAYEESALRYKLSTAVSVAPLHPVFIAKCCPLGSFSFCQARRKCRCTLVRRYPRSLTEKGMVRLKAITKKVAPSFDLSGPCVCNTQVIKKPAAGPDNEPQLKVTEYSI